MKLKFLNLIFYFIKRKVKNVFFLFLLLQHEKKKNNLAKQNKKNKIAYG